MSSLVQDAARVQLSGGQPWPNDVQLFQPFEEEQILLLDYANCLSVKAFLNICSLEYTTEFRKNAEYISPSGKVPFLRAGQILISDFEPIVEFVTAKGYTLSSKLNETERAEMKAYMVMIEHLLVKAVLYLSWCDEEDSVTEVSKQRYGSPYLWPLNVIIPWRKQRAVRRYLAGLGWAQKSMDEVCQEVTTCCQALSQKLGDRKYFFGDSPTELDALVYGHLYTILTVELPVMRLADIVASFENLEDFCKRINTEFFRKSNES